VDSLERGGVHNHPGPLFGIMVKQKYGRRSNRIGFCLHSFLNDYVSLLIDGAAPGKVAE